MLDEMVTPSFNTRSYNPRHSIAIRDRWQQFLYTKHGAYPLDMYVDSQENLVMIYDKEETRELYKLYREYKLK